MPNRTELIQQRAEVDKALNQLIQQGDVVPDEQREELGAKYKQLWEIRQQMTAELERGMGSTNLPAVQAPAGPPAPAGTRRIRWGVVAIGGAGVLALLGLLGWQIYKVHGKRKARKKSRR